MPPGQERGLEEPVAPLDQPLELRVPRRRQPDPTPRVPANAAASHRQLARCRRSRPPGPTPASVDTRPTPPIRSPTSRPGCPRPAGDGIITASVNREYPHVITSTGSTRSCARRRPGSGLGGNHRSHCAISPGAYSTRSTGSGGTNNGRSSAHPVLQHRQRLRSSRSAPRSPSPASSGTRANNARICGSNASTADPCGARSIPRRPVRRQRRPHRVPRHPQPPSDLLDRHTLRRCSRRISAQSSTLITPQAVVLRGAQLSPVDYGPVFTRRRQARPSPPGGGRGTRPDPSSA